MVSFNTSISTSLAGVGACLLPHVVIAGATRAFRPHDEQLIQEYELALDGIRLCRGSK